MGDEACPFCASTTFLSAGRPVGKRRLARVAAIAAIAAIGAGCGGETVPTSDAGVDAGTDSGTKKDSGIDAATDAGLPDVISLPPYGIPPIDGG